MIFLEFKEPANSKWLQWINDCEKATIQLIKDYQLGKTLNISKDLYSRQKAIFKKKPFYGKCAYCESSVDVNSPTVVEHFRPKKSVRDINNKIVKVRGSAGNTKKQHPGYYWLAYKWTNLLPACSKCNTWHVNNKPSDKKIGKGERFPVKNYRALNQGDEEREEALLINPMFEDPVKHIFINELGVICSEDKSIIGETVIDIFGLDIRKTLVEFRKLEYDNMTLRFKAYVHMDDSNPRKIEEWKKIKKIHNGKHPYTLAARQAISDVIELINKSVKGFPVNVCK